MDDTKYYIKHPSHAISEYDFLTFLKYYIWGIFESSLRLDHIGDGGRGGGDWKPPTKCRRQHLWILLESICADVAQILKTF